MNIQFKKGVLELCVLSLLNMEDRYGYELVETISEDISISEGTIYPMLRRFKNDGLVITYLKESTSGPSRKYYSITDKGREFYLYNLSEWNNFVDSVNKILRSDNS
ncbi:MAG: PadR family transcriptional regulator [Tissierellia bacterium]|nr:PadR family transcriptional regulator [Tissierellia bacterium]